MPSGSRRPCLPLRKVPRRTPFVQAPDRPARSRSRRASARSPRAHRPVRPLRRTATRSLPTLPLTPRPGGSAGTSGASPLLPVRRTAIRRRSRFRRPCDPSLCRTGGGNDRASSRCGAPSQHASSSFAVCGGRGAISGPSAATLRDRFARDGRARAAHRAPVGTQAPCRDGLPTGTSTGRRPPAAAAGHRSSRRRRRSPSGRAGRPALPLPR